MRTQAANTETAPILDCVPEAVAVLVPHVDIMAGKSGKLLRDPRASGAWSQLVKHAKIRAKQEPDTLRARLDALEDTLQPETWDRWGRWNRRELWERAVASVFLGVALECAINRSPVPVREIDREIERWRTGAMLCREAQGAPYRGAVDSELKAALEIVANYFTGWAKFMEGAKTLPSAISGPTRLQRGGGVGPFRQSDETVRVRARGIALRIRDVLGMPLYGTTATFANVAFDISPLAKVTPKDIENWMSRELS